MFQRLSFLIFLLLLLFLPGPAQAITTSGVLAADEIWNGQVLLTGDVTAPDGITLTVEPGTRVLFAAGSDDRAGGQDSSKTELIIYGKLFALGAPDNKIIFTTNSQSPTKGDWGGIWISKNADEQFRIENCEIEYAGTGLKYEALSGTHNISIYNCAFRHAPNEGLHIYGKGGAQVTVDVKRNEVSHNSVAGIYLGGTGASTKISGAVQENMAYANGTGAPWNISGGIFLTIDDSAEADLSVSRNTLIDNEYYGVVLFCGRAYPDQKHCRLVINGNTLNNGIDGIACDVSDNYEMTLEISENEMTSCSGSGISCGGGGNSAVFHALVSDNFVTGCNNGISLYDGFSYSEVTVTGNIVCKDWVGIRLSGSGLNSQIKITENQVDENGSGIILGSAGNVRISNNSACNNRLSGIDCRFSEGDFALLDNKACGNKNGIYCISKADSNRVEVKGNEVAGNAKKGIYAVFFGYDGRLGMKITANSVCGNGENGIECRTNFYYGYEERPEINLVIGDNHIHANKINGLYCSMEAPVKIIRNDIRNNLADGMYISAWPGSVINFNNLIDNRGYYEITNGINPLNARSNYWGGSISSEMASGGNPKDISRIYDKYDDPKMGTVDYGNWLNKVVLIRPAILSAIAQSSSVYLKWTSVAAASGYKLHYGTSPGNYEQSIDLGNKTDFILKDLINDRTCYAALTAYNSIGDASEFSEEVTVTPTESAGNPAFFSFDKEYYNGTASEKAKVTLVDPDLNTDPASSEIVSIRIRSCSDFKGLDLSLSENDLNSGNFTSDSTLSLEKSDPLNNCIKIADGDLILAVYSDKNPLQKRRAKAIIDLSPPTTTLIPSPELYFDGDFYYASMQVSYSLWSTDLYSGIDKTQYQIDGSEFHDYTEPFKLSTPGTHVLSYKARDKAGNWEETKSLTILIEDTVPVSPEGVSESLGDLQVDLSWLPNSETDIRGYYVYRNGLRATQSPISDTFYSEALSAGTIYAYNITAVDRAGNESPFSNTVSVTTLSIPPVIELSGIGSLFTESEISITGTTDPSATIEIFLNGISQGTAVANIGGRFCLSNVKIFDGENAITAVSVNSYGTKAPPSNTVTFYADPRPAAPIGLTGISGDTVATINWQPNSESDIQGYIIYRDGVRLNYSLLINTGFQDVLLTNEREYVYTVTALDQRGTEGKVSAPLKIVTKAGPQWEIQ